MHKYATLFYILTAALSCASAAQAFTITFDDDQAGSVIYSYDQGINTVLFHSFSVFSHSASAWGPPHSGANVLGWSGVGYPNPAITFGRYDAVTGRPLTSLLSFSAYFSTAPGALLTMTVYNDAVKYHSPNGSIQIGGTGELWDNRYIEVDSPTGAINSVGFEAVSSGALSGFCLDDLSVTPVPEPSSLAALFCGLAGVGGVVVRRRPSAEQGRM